MQNGSTSSQANSNAATLSVSATISVAVCVSLVVVIAVIGMWIRLNRESASVGLDDLQAGTTRPRPASALAPGGPASPLAKSSNIPPPRVFSNQLRVRPSYAPSVPVLVALRNDHATNKPQDDMELKYGDDSEAGVGQNLMKSQLASGREKVSPWSESPPSELFVKAVRV